jgi:hypothetical protein
MQIIAIRLARKDQAFLAHDDQATLSVLVWAPPLIPHPSRHKARVDHIVRGVSGPKPLVPPVITRPCMD